MSEVEKVREELIPRLITELRLGKVTTRSEIVDRLTALLPLLKRKHHKRGKARATMQRVTPEIRDAVKRDIALHPNRANRDIGKTYGIDGGRVSEILAGDYDDL